MADRPPKILICSCEDTMPLDGAAVQRGCRGAELLTARQLCRAELEKFRAAAASGEPLVVGCTQEAPLFSELAGDTAVTYANIRETAGWSKDAGAAGPKMAALLAAAAEPVPEFSFVNLTSDGVILIYGRDEQAIEAGNLLKDHLDVTVLIKPPADVSPPRVTDFPVVRGAIRSAKGYLGKFELTVDGYAQPAPSSRGAFSFPTTRDGAVSRCDLVLDLSGGAPLFTASDLRDGYLRADPGDPAAVLKAVLKARDLVGSFDKPRYVAFTADLCAHSRSKIVGCTRCLDLCPTGAIAPAGDHVAIDAYICAGCGQCAAVCPTGAAAYALPPADALMRKLRSLVTTYRDAGGTQPAVVLMHDEAHGVPLIDALARFGDGLAGERAADRSQRSDPDRSRSHRRGVCLRRGAVRVAAARKAAPRHRRARADARACRADPRRPRLWRAAGPRPSRRTIPMRSPTRCVRSAARTQRRVPQASCRSGRSETCMRLALRELQRAAPAPVDVVALPAGAPFGAVEINVEGCTLCLACVAACPTGALSDNPERPMLRFAEDACVQCGLCKATCPEKVITLRPQLDFRAATASCTRAQGGGAVPLHPLRQAVRRQEHDRARLSPSSKASTGCFRIPRSAST